MFKTYKKKNKRNVDFTTFLSLKIMPQTGIEPVREYKSRRILSPVRLPVPPLRHMEPIGLEPMTLCL